MLSSGQSTRNAGDDERDFQVCTNPVSHLISWFGGAATLEWRGTVSGRPYPQPPSPSPSSDITTQNLQIRRSLRNLQLACNYTDALPIASEGPNAACGPDLIAESRSAEQPCMRKAAPSICSASLHDHQTRPLPHTSRLYFSSISTLAMLDTH